MFEFIKEYYDLKLYTASDLDIFIKANMLTEDEKAKIIGSTTATS